MPTTSTRALFSTPARYEERRETVCLLHSGSGDEPAWLALAQQLEPQFALRSLHRPGHGQRPARPAAAAQALAVDAQAVWALAGADPVHLVGCGYGAALALQMALADPTHVLSLTLYEPLALGLLGSDDLAGEEMRDIATSVSALQEAGRSEDAARVYLGYWGGGSAWARLTPEQRQTWVAQMGRITRDLDALFAAPWQPHALAALRMPLLLLRGSVTRAPVRAVHERLAQLLLQAQCAELPGAGHLGPQTHAPSLARWMAAHLNPALAAA